MRVLIEQVSVAPLIQLLLLVLYVLILMPDGDDGAVACFAYPVPFEWWLPKDTNVVAERFP
jgi:hypothetical protein